MARCMVATTMKTRLTALPAMPGRSTAWLEQSSMLSRLPGCSAKHTWLTKGGCGLTDGARYWAGGNKGQSCEYATGAYLLPTLAPSGIQTVAVCWGLPYLHIILDSEPLPILRTERDAALRGSPKPNLQGTSAGQASSSVTRAARGV